MPEDTVLYIRHECAHRDIFAATVWCSFSRVNTLRQMCRYLGSVGGCLGGRTRLSRSCMLSRLAALSRLPDLTMKCSMEGDVVNLVVSATSDLPVLLPFIIDPTGQADSHCTSRHASTRSTSKHANGDCLSRHASSHSMARHADSCCTSRHARATGNPGKQVTAWQKTSQSLYSSRKANANKTPTHKQTYS